MWLNIGMVCAKEFASTVTREVFNNIDTLATAVITLCGKTFCIFIGKHRSLGFHNRARGEVF